MLFAKTPSIPLLLPWHLHTATVKHCYISSPPKQLRTHLQIKCKTTFGFTAILKANYSLDPIHCYLNHSYFFLTNVMRSCCLSLWMDQMWTQSFWSCCRSMNSTEGLIMVGSFNLHNLHITPAKSHSSVSFE